MVSVSHSGSEASPGPGSMSTELLSLLWDPRVLFCGSPGQSAVWEVDHTCQVSSQVARAARMKAAESASHVMCGR
eukprot:352902-Chlamydomonas_euryale.AAC.6